MALNVSEKNNKFLKALNLFFKLPVLKNESVTKEINSENANGTMDKKNLFQSRTITIEEKLVNTNSIKIA